MVPGLHISYILCHQFSGRPFASEKTPKDWIWTILEASCTALINTKRLSTSVITIFRYSWRINVFLHQESQKYAIFLWRNSKMCIVLILWNTCIDIYRAKHLYLNVLCKILNIYFFFVKWRHVRAARLALIMYMASLYTRVSLYFNSILH